MPFLINQRYRILTSEGILSLHSLNKLFPNVQVGEIGEGGLCFLCSDKESSQFLNIPTSSLSIANIIHMVAGIIFFREHVQSVVSALCISLLTWSRRY